MAPCVVVLTFPFWTTLDVSCRSRKFFILVAFAETRRDFHEMCHVLWRKAATRTKIILYIVNEAIVLRKSGVANEMSADGCCWKRQYHHVFICTSAKLQPDGSVHCNKSGSANSWIPHSLLESCTNIPLQFMNYFYGISLGLIVITVPKNHHSLWVHEMYKWICSLRNKASLTWQQGEALL